MSLALSRVEKRFGSARALAGIDLDLAAARTAIVGPSGSGKTTLLRVVAGFERPDAGRVQLDGVVLADEAGFVPAHRRGIGYVSQDGALFPHLSVADNVGFGLPRRGRDREARIRALLAMVELDRGFATRRPHELSGGQQQRVALARALALEPRLMLLDEPFSALDPGLREGLRESVARLLEGAGIATILVTHDRDEALSYADRLVVLSEGRVARVGPPRDVYLRPGDRDVALLLGDAVLLPAILGDGFAECSLGRLPADCRGGGRAEIMIRHEQIRLTRGERGARFEVAAVAFRGSSSTVSLALAGAAPSLRVTLSGPSPPEPGERVGIEILGRVHALRPATGDDVAPDRARPADAA